MRLSGLDMYALLAATRLYLDTPDPPRLSPVERKALDSACTILRMASDCLEPAPRPRIRAVAPGTSTGEANIALTPSEAGMLAKAASTCLESGLLLAGLRAAYSKLVAGPEQ